MIFCHTGGDTLEAVSEKQNSDHFSAEAFWFLHACPQVVLLDESYIALFAFRITFVILGEIPLKQSSQGGAILTF